MTSVSTAGIIAVAEPVVTLAFSIALKIEPMKGYKGLSMFLGVCGNGVMVGVQGVVSNNADSTYILGCISVLCSVFGYATFLIVQTKIDHALPVLFVQAFGLRFQLWGCGLRLSFSWTNTTRCSHPLRGQCGAQRSTQDLFPPLYRFC